MKVYLISDHQSVAQDLEHGIRRSDGREYVLTSWEDVDKCLKARSLLENTDELASKVRVLQLEVDGDILARAPIPRQRLPSALDEETVRELQSRSRYLETDVSSRRIEKVLNAFGVDLKDTYGTKKPRTANILRFFGYARPHLKFVGIATVAGIFKFLIPLVFPWFLQVVLDDILPRKDLNPAQKMTEVAFYVALVLALHLVWMAVTYLRHIYTARAGHGMIRDLRIALFGHLQRLSHQFFSTHQSGSIVSRVVHDISQAQNLVGSALTNVWMDLILMIVLLFILFPLDPKLTLVALAPLPFFLLTIRMVGARVRLATSEVQQRVEVLTGGLQEKMAGISVLKGFTREKAELVAFRSQAGKLYNKVLMNVRWVTFNEMFVGFIMMGAPLLIVYFGAEAILEERLTVGELTRFLLYLSSFYGPVQRLSDLGTVLASSLASIDRIFEYFDFQPRVAERPDAKPLAMSKGEIRFEGVGFSYEEGNPILSEIDFLVEPGQTIAFVGPSGSGKTTLANLLPRFYDPTKGRILLDGLDLRDIKLEDLRRQIGIVNQDTILFTGTIRENLLMANPKASSDHLLKALEAANALEFVDDLPEGLWTEIGERGVRLSGGQRQRLALARAFLKDPRILILDEATSALDSRSERLIQEALGKLLKNRTAIVIAHRLSTILEADRIATFEHGKLVEIGSHQELLAQGGLYAQLFKEQFQHQGPEIE